MPAQIRVVRITKPKRVCFCYCSLHQAPAPQRVLAGGLAAPGLIAHVLVSRHCDHLPLSRRRRIFAWHGLEISRCTPCGRIDAACRWLEALRARWSRTSCPAITSSPTICCCRCSIAAQAGSKPATSGPARETTSPIAAQCRPWCCIASRTALLGVPPSTSGPPAAFRRSAATPGSRHRPTEAPSSWLPAGCTPAAGLSSCMRQAPVATKAVRRSAELQQVETEIRARLPDERRAVRAERSIPPIEALHAWLDLERSRLPGRGRLATAIRYVLGRWRAPTRFLDDGGSTSMSIR